MRDHCVTDSKQASCNSYAVNKYRSHKTKAQTTPISDSKFI